MENKSNYLRESWTSFLSSRDKSFTLHLQIASKPLILKIFTKIPHSRAYHLGINLSVICRAPGYSFSILRVPNRFFGIRNFPCLKLGIRDFGAKSGRDWQLKVYVGGEMPIVTLGITGFHESLGLAYGIEIRDSGF